MKELAALRAKTYSYLTDITMEIQEYVTKGKLKFQDYKNCLKATQLENKINQLKK